MACGRAVSHGVDREQQKVLGQNTGGQGYVYDTGVTTRLGTDGWKTENNKKWNSLGKRLVLIGTGAGKQFIPQVRSLGWTLGSRVIEPCCIQEHSCSGL